MISNGFVQSADIFADTFADRFADRVADRFDDFYDFAMLVNSVQ